MVGHSSLLVGNLKKYAQGFLPEKLLQQDHTTTTDSEMEEPYLQESKEEGTPLKLKCELCGRVDFAYKFKRSKRFCSMACAKRYAPSLRCCAQPLPSSQGCTLVPSSLFPCPAWKQCPVTCSPRTP